MSNGTGPDLDDGIGSNAGLTEGPCNLAVRNPADVLIFSIKNACISQGFERLSGGRNTYSAIETWFVLDAVDGIYIPL